MQKFNSFFKSGVTHRRVDRCTSSVQGKSAKFIYVTNTLKARFITVSCAMHTLIRRRNANSVRQQNASTKHFCIQHKKLFSTLASVVIDTLYGMNKL